MAKFIKKGLFMSGVVLGNEVRKAVTKVRREQEDEGFEAVKVQERVLKATQTDLATQSRCVERRIMRLERQEQARLARFQALEEDVQAQGLVARVVAGIFSRVQQQLLQEDLGAIRHQQAAVAQESEQLHEAAVVERETVVSRREAFAVDAEVHSLTVSLFANVKTAMLEEDRADLAAQQAANAERAERLVDAQVDSVLSSLVLDLERSLLADEADALTAQKVKTAQDWEELDQEQAVLQTQKAAQEADLAQQHTALEHRVQECAAAEAHVLEGGARLEQVQEQQQALEEEIAAQKGAVQQRENACSNHEQALQQRTEELAASQAALVFDKEQTAKEQAVLVQERQRLVQDQTDHQDLVAIFDDEMTAREDAALASEIQLGETANQLRTKAESVANGMAASAVMRRALLSGQHTLKTERTAFEAHKLQASTALKTDRAAFEAYQHQSAIKLKFQSQVADARELRLSQAEKAVQARQTSSAAMEARLNRKTLDLAKGEQAVWAGSILDDHRTVKLAAERRTATLIFEINKTTAYELRMVNRAADMRARQADLDTKEAAFDVKAAEVAKGQDAFTVDQAAFKADQAAFKKFQEQSANEIASQITEAEARKVRLTTAEAALKADQAGLEAREAKLKIDVADFAKEMAHLQKQQADSATEAEQAAQEVARLQKQQAISASEAEQAAQEVERLQKRCNDLEEMVKGASACSPRADATAQPVVFFASSPGLPDSKNAVVSSKVSPATPAGPHIIADNAGDGSDSPSDSSPGAQVSAGSAGGGVSSEVSPAPPAADADSLPNADKGTDADAPALPTASDKFPISSQSPAPVQEGTAPLIREMRSAKHPKAAVMAVKPSKTKTGQRKLVPLPRKPQATVGMEGSAQQADCEPQVATPSPAVVEPVNTNPEVQDLNSMRSSSLHDAALPRTSINSVEPAQVSVYMPTSTLNDIPIGSSASAAIRTAAQTDAVEQRQAPDILFGSLPPSLRHRLSIPSLAHQVGPSAAKTTAAAAAPTVSGGGGSSVASSTAVAQTVRSGDSSSPAAANTAAPDAYTASGGDGSSAATTIAAPPAPSSSAQQHQLPTRLSSGLSVGQAQNSGDEAKSSAVSASTVATDARTGPALPSQLPAHLADRLSFRQAQRLSTDSSSASAATTSTTSGAQRSPAQQRQLPAALASRFSVGQAWKPSSHGGSFPAVHGQDTLVAHHAAEERQLPAVAHSLSDGLAQRLGGQSEPLRRELGIKAGKTHERNSQVPSWQHYSKYYGLEQVGSGLEFRGSGAVPSGIGKTYSGSRAEIGGCGMDDRISGEDTRGFGMDDSGSAEAISGGGLVFRGSGLGYSGSDLGSGSNSWSPRNSSRSVGGHDSDRHRHTGAKALQHSSSTSGRHYSGDGWVKAQHADAKEQHSGWSDDENEQQTASATWLGACESRDTAAAMDQSQTYSPAAKSAGGKQGARGGAKAPSQQLYVAKGGRRAAGSPLQSLPNGPTQPKLQKSGQKWGQRGGQFRR